MVGKFKDEWVVDRTMFEFINGGSCACCGMSQLFLPDGLKGIINSISDIETDAASAELAAAERSSWPPELREEVWVNRFRLRFEMKKEIKLYKEFFQIHDKSDVKRWCQDEIGTLSRLFQLPRSEIIEIARTKYGIHGGFEVVLCSVIEQVANFPKTKYGTDGFGNEEVAFEKLLQFDRRAGFIFPSDSYDVFLTVMFRLGGPKLLDRGPSSSIDQEDEGGADDPYEDTQLNVGKGPSFRSDRRIIRLLIARYWADQIISKYNAANKMELS